MMKEIFMRFLVFVFSIIFGIKIATAQDVMFSQYNQMPIHINPAMTGFHDGMVRVGAIYRNQWMPQGGFGASFNTGGGFLDASLLKDKLKNDYLGIGASATFDKNGINIYQTTNVSLNLAYSKGFGRNVKHSLALGFGGEMKLGSLNLSNATFSDGVNENIAKSNFLFDANVGLRYHLVVPRKFNGYIGFAYHHLLQPNEGWVSGGTGRWNARYSVHLGSEIHLNDKWNLVPTGIFILQASHLQAQVGAMGQYKFGNSDFPSARISAGLQTRFGAKGIDAVILVTKVDIKRIYFGISFDANVSPLSKSTKGYGALELSIGYTFIKNDIQRESKTPCPSF
jgi:type IX secretion system PorP/SprF family membrane protein